MLRAIAHLTVCVLVVLCAQPATEASTFEPLTFEEVVGHADLIVQGRVVDRRYVTSDLPAQRATRSSEVTSTSPRSERDAAERAPAVPGTPQSLPIEGTPFVVTEITLEVEEVVAGRANSTVTFRVAGGFANGVQMEVQGMPSFDLGERYVVFLRPGYEDARVADPIVGVNQGYFRVAPDEPTSGRAALLNAHSDVVVAIEEGRVAVRRGPNQAHMRQGPLPVSEDDPTVKAKVSPEARRYWESNEEPMGLEAFKAAVRQLRGE